MNEQAISVDDAIALAVELNRRGEQDQAEAVCDRVLEALPTHPDALHFRGLLYYQRNQRQEALAMLERARAEAPNNPHVHNNLGNLLFGEDRMAEAEASYARAIALLPDLQALYYNRSKALRYLGRQQEALDLLYGAVTKFPSDPEAYRRAALLLSTAGRLGEAADVYRRWLLIEPDNEVVKHLLIACSGGVAPGRASDDSVKKEFDEAAEAYDLVMSRLNYRGPALIATAVADAVGAPTGGLDVVDLGCGTGLVGPHLRPYARHLVGVDLAAEMVGKARARGVYDDLVVAELTAYLAEGAPARFHLAISADTLVYFGDLAAAFAGAARALRPGGRLVFIVERHDDAETGYRLQPHGRYSHHQDYLRRELARAQFRTPTFEPCEHRSEFGAPVTGWLVTATL